MARKLNENLLSKLKDGEYKNLFLHIKSDEELRFEVRPDNKAMVYYEGNKILEIGFQSLSVDPKWGANIPNAENAKDNPKDYFKKMKICIKENLEKKNDKQEFETQQNIARNNADCNDEYIIIDMEYQAPQDKIPSADRLPAAKFDLIGIKKTTGDIVLLEVKKGLGSLKDSSGIKKHIDDFGKFFVTKKKLFESILKEDIEGIIDSKVELGLLKRPEKINYSEIKFMFIFESKEKPEEEKSYREIFLSEAGEKAWKNYPTILVKSSDYKLNETKIMP